MDHAHQDQDTEQWRSRLLAAEGEAAALKAQVIALTEQSVTSGQAMQELQHDMEVYHGKGACAVQSLAAFAWISWCVLHELAQLLRGHAMHG